MSPNDPSIAISELQRLLHNIVRVGVISAVDHGGPDQPARVRVSIGDLTTDWRPYHECRAGGTTTWNPPTVGEQATVLSPSGDLGAAVVLVGLNSTQHPAPSSNPSQTVTRYPDGAVVQYDHAAHALAATLPEGGTATLKASGGVSITSQITTINGDCQINGTLRATGDVVANGVSLVEHVHSGVQPGNAWTEVPR